MPILIWVGAGIAGLFGIGAAANGVDNVIHDVTGVPKQGTNVSAVPSWVIPTVLVGVGGLLLYKYGAKVLKV